MLPISVRPERLWYDGPSIQGIRGNLVYILSLILANRRELDSKPSVQFRKFILLLEQTPGFRVHVRNGREHASLSCFLASSLLVLLHLLPTLVALVAEYVWLRLVRFSPALRFAYGADISSLTSRHSDAQWSEVGN